VIAFVLSSLPVLAWYVRRAMDSSDEPLGIIALGAALVTIAVSARYGHRDRDRVWIRAERLIACAVLLVAVQVTGLVKWPLVLGLLAVTGIAWSVTMPRAKAGLVMLLVLSLPLVATLDFFAGYPMRWVAANLAHALLAVAGVPVERSGVMLLDSGRIVGIDPPCAGIRMLWTACFVAAVLAARMRLSWPRTLTLAGLAVACVVIGNGLRAAIVYLPESGRVSWPDWAHPGAGLLIHAGVLAIVSAAGSRFSRVASSDLGQRFVRIGFAAVMMLGVATIVVSGAAGRTQVEGVRLDPWPATIGGIPLVALPLSKAEQSFARAFPGDVARFACGASEVILRRTTRPTRMMHPAAHCLRAAGFETHSEPLFRDTDGRVWGQLRATRDGRTFRVLERYADVSETTTATDASAWFWQALASPDDGPWTGITRIELLTDPAIDR
jgi:exosortase/archaeosortase family protein